jgi:hypothetical protein
MDVRQKYIDNIIKITDEDNVDIVINSITVNFSYEHNLYNVVLNGKRLTKNCKYLICNRCVACNNIHCSSVTNFIRKINKLSSRCDMCKDINNMNNNKLNKTLTELKQESIDLFKKFDDNFKSEYFKFHLTEDEFQRISKSLISVQNGKIDINSNIEYWPIFMTENDVSFNCCLYDKQRDTILKINHPVLKCENCHNTWTGTILEKFKNCHKVICSQCISTSDNKCKIKAVKNILNQNVLYQTNMQLKFIKWCNANNFVIVNGEKMLDYKINHILIKVMDKPCNSDTYIIIHPKNWMKSLDQIRYSLTSYENMRNNS